MVHQNLGRYKLGVKEWDPRKKFSTCNGIKYDHPKHICNGRGKCQFTRFFLGDKVLEVCAFLRGGITN
jgi:hypothetical protein